MSLYNSKIAAIFNNCGILPFPPLHFLISVILLIEIQISNMHNIILNSKGVFAKLKTRWIDTPSSAFFFHGLFTDEKTKRILSRIDASRLIFQSTVSFQPAWMQKKQAGLGSDFRPACFLHPRGKNQRNHRTNPKFRSVLRKFSRDCRKSFEITMRNLSW